jgi:hypothetical protein
MVWIVAESYQMTRLNCNGSSAFELVFKVVWVHELCHAWSHAGLSHHSRTEWDLGRAFAAPSGIHEIIAEYFSLLVFRKFVSCPAEILEMHSLLCEDAPEEYRLWKLLENTPLDRVQAALVRWRETEPDFFIRDGLGEFLKEKSTELAEIFASHEDLRSAYEHALKDLGKAAERLEMAKSLQELWTLLADAEPNTDNPVARVFGDWLAHAHPGITWPLDSIERRLRIAELAAQGGIFTKGVTEMLAAQPLPLDDNNPFDLQVIVNHLEPLLSTDRAEAKAVDYDPEHVNRGDCGIIPPTVP